MNTERGFTLIEVMITVAIVAILAAVALPSYTAYVQRSRVPPALDALSSIATRLEQRYQDTGNYGNVAGTACGVTTANTDNFTISCALDGTVGVQGYLLTATGSGPVSGYAYTLNHRGARVTTAHPKGTNANCWTMKGSVCDS